MNSSQTKWLIGLALALLALIAFTELRRPAAPPAPVRAALVPELRPATVTRIEFTGSSNVTLHAELKAGQWQLVTPVSYPAHTGLLKALLDFCARYQPPLDFPVAEAKSLTEFGLAPPQAILRFHQGGPALELRIGNRTPVNQQLYIQLGGQSRVAVADAALLEFLPVTADAWRDRQFIALDPLKFDRLRLRTGARNTAWERNPTNQLWRIVLPTPVKRANTPLIETILAQLRAWPVQQFITDNPRADLDPFGLTTPETELAFGTGTNDTLVLQFGISPTNNPTHVFARSLATTNVMLVPRALLDSLHADLWDFSEHRLLDTLPPEAFDTITVQGRENFTLRFQTNTPTGPIWQANDALQTTTDPELMRGFLANLEFLSAVERDKEVVTDYGPYGLAQVTRSLSLLKSGTNALGTATNQLVARLDFGHGPLDRQFVRRHDESAVYVVPRGDVDRLAWSLHQVQDRTVWSFTTNQVTAVQLSFDGRSRRLTRAPNGRWTDGAEPADEIKNLALEETIFRLGQLRAVQWSFLADDANDRRLPIYGLSPTSHRLSLELAASPGFPARTNTLTLGFSSPTRNPWATVPDRRTSRPLIFEFPRALHRDYLIPYLSVPL